jgi:FKBP-type peptidyl-prolyl cis-trans isomerase FklB
LLFQIFLAEEGAKWELYIKSELGYGDRGAGGLIKGGDVLIFEMELLKVGIEDDGGYY